MSCQVEFSLQIVCTYTRTSEFNWKISQLSFVNIFFIHTCLKKGYKASLMQRLREWSVDCTGRTECLNILSKITSCLTRIDAIVVNVIFPIMSYDWYDHIKLHQTGPPEGRRTWALVLTTFSGLKGEKSGFYSLLLSTEPY